MGPATEARYGSSMVDGGAPKPDNTAVRVALWRALHVLADPPPHVFEDPLGLALADPGPDWRARPDMGPFTRPFRASIVARARYVEDHLASQVALGVSQYVLLGAGLDTFTLRRPELAAKLQVYEIDAPGTQRWKQGRLTALGVNAPPTLHFVPVDFEAGQGWLAQLQAAGFDPRRPAVVASTGVSMYLSLEAIRGTLREVAGLARGSSLVLSFLNPIELAEPELRPGIEAAARGARAAGTPWISFFRPEEMVDLAIQAGFEVAQHVSAEALNQRYFAGRSDGLRVPLRAEELLVAQRS